MDGKLPYIKKCWRALLRRYYSFEHSVLNDSRKLEKFKSFCALLPINSNKVVIDSFGGKGYGENAKYIVEELLRRNKNYRIVWLVNDPCQIFPERIKPVLKYSLRAYYESATAKVWIFNTRNCRLVNKRKRQIYLQTWHGSIGAKKIEKDAEKKLSKKYVDAAKEDGRVSDGILADNAFIEKIYERSFWLNDQCEVLQFGSPKIDILFNTDAIINTRKKVRCRLGVHENAYVVLYAPTFRNSGSTENYIDDIEEVRKAFSINHADVVILVRLHPNVAQTASKLRYSFSNHLIDVTNYADPQELIIASDSAITDYSSIIYDFALMRKPGFLCMKDLDAYISERGVYDLFYEQPFRLNYRETDLINDISTFSTQEYQRKLDLFYNKYPTYNKGNASKQTVDWLISKGLKK